MAVVLLIPHIFVVPDFTLLVESEGHEAVDCFGRVEKFGRVFVAEFEDDLRGSCGDDFGCYGAELGEDLVWGERVEKVRAGSGEGHSGAGAEKRRVGEEKERRCVSHRAGVEVPEPGVHVKP